MARTILVTVGISLITEKTGEKETATGGFGQLEGAFSSLSALQKGLEEADRKQKEGRPFNPDARKWVEARDALVQKLQALWGKPDTELNDDVKRAWSGAELASLQLLGREKESLYTLLSAEDRVVLLASDTPSGLFCARVIQDVLGKPLSNWPQIFARCEKVIGLRADKAKSFLYEGLPEVAHLMFQAYAQAQANKQETVLIASGGYKGLLPFLTPLAMNMRIPLFYLYEESGELMEIQPLQLPTDIDLIKLNISAFELLDPAKFSEQDGDPIAHPSAFWARASASDKQKLMESHLLTVNEESVKLTTVGVLAFLLCRQERTVGQGADVQPLLSPLLNKS